MQQLSTLNRIETIDHENLNIIIQPRPPKRRQSGVSLVPFRPYVKCLTSIREPFSFTDGINQWKTIGRRETFFKQQNARCIGSLIDDCDISEVIRWDIEGESTRLPMMCKFWMIVDGAVVERGKPHLVQDAAIQVYTAGRNRRSILEAEQRYTKISFSSLNRRRRHSWHDVNEYHSVPYYQYTRTVKLGYQEGIQCDMDNEHVTSKQEYLSFIMEETVDENQLHRFEEHKAKETVHNQSILQNHVQVSSMTQTENQFIDRSTEIDIDFVQLFNLNIQTNENVLSSIVNPYIRQYSSYYPSHTIRTFHNGIEYKSRSVSTGDDYPQWWLQFSTNVLLSDRLTNQGEEKKKYISIPPSPRQLDQSSQTDTAYNSEIEIERTRPSSTRSSRLQKTSSSMTINDNYEIIDQINDGNNSRRIFPYQEQRQRIDSDSHLSDYQIETLSNRDNGRLRCTTSLSKQSDPDYNTFSLELNQQSYSTPEPYTIQTTYHNSSLNDTNRKNPTDNTSTNVLTTLLQRYERTLKERQRAIAIVNNQLLDMDDVLNYYRKKIQNSDRTMELYHDIRTLSSQAKEEIPSSSLTIARLTKDKYRTMPNITSEDMLHGYIPSPRIHITNSYRQPRFDYCDLCLTDYDTSSAWIRYNEQRIDQLQKRIDLMLEIDDNEEYQLFLSPDTITNHIDDILNRKMKHRHQLNLYHNRILLPHRYNFRYPYRLNQTSLPNSPRLLTRNLIRSTKPITKSVRISTEDKPIRLHEPSNIISQPIVSILRRNNTNNSSRSHRILESSHIWKNESDGKIYILKPFSIPRYYRLYNDVSFREMYHFSRLLDTYVNRSNSQNYSSIIKNFAVEQQLPTITSVA